MLGMQLRAKLSDLFDFYVRVLLQIAIKQQNYIRGINSHILEYNFIRNR